MVNLAQLAVLKEKLVQAKEFMPVLDYFMTHFGENPQFMNMGKRSRQPVVEAAVTETMQRLYGKAISPKRLLLTRLAQERFVHGGGMFESRVLTIFYFEEIQMGLLAIASPFTTDEIKLARFTGTVLSNN